MGASFFVTGTNTDVGKTWVAAGLLSAAQKAGFSTVAIKPVAAGCETTAEGLRNEDALTLQAASSINLPYQQINPVTLEPPIAPHIAAAEAGVRMSAERLVGYCRGVMMAGADLCLIEGAGGWRVPLNERETLADVAKQLECGVILVVAMQLGCINHAMLTAEAIARDGLPLAGWVANSTGPQMPYYQENMDTLKQALAAPLLGEVPYLPEADIDQIADYLNPKLLLG